MSLRAISVAILNDLEDLNETHEFYPLWESYGDELKRYAEEGAATEKEHLRLAEQELQERLLEAIELLYRRKAKLQDEYGISDGEINTESNREI